MRHIKFNLPRDHNLFLFGDDHEGSVLRYDAGWNKLLDMMNSEFEGCDANYGWHHGDPMEAITIDDPRYDLETTKDPIPLKQVDAVIKNLLPIKSQLLGMNEGNHTRKLWRFGNLTQKICLELGIMYGTWTAKLLIHDKKGRLMYRSFHTHGKKSIHSAAEPLDRRITNMKIILQRHLRDKMGDTILMCKGHVHKLLVLEPQSPLYLSGERSVKQKYVDCSIDARAPYIHPDHRWYVCTGSFLKMYEEGLNGYAEMAEYDPIELGFAVVIIRNGKMITVKRIVV